MIADARARIAQNDAGFASDQQIRLARLEQRIDDYFDDADQLASTTAAIIYDERLDRSALTDRLLTLYRSHTNDPIYIKDAFCGLGMFYAPFAFDPHTRLLNVYIHPYVASPKDLRYGPLRKFDRLGPKGTVVVDFESNQVGGTDDYTRWLWYVRGVQARGELAWFGPYSEDGRSFISTLQAVYKGGRLLGVVAVDAYTVRFKQLMTVGLAPGDIGWIESSKRGRYLLATSQLPDDKSDRRDAETPLHLTGAYIHVSSDAKPLIALDRSVVLTAGGLLAAIWCLAFALGASLVWNWNARERTLALEAEQARLENEIAVGKRVESELRKAAYADSLTSLPNRAAFLERAHAAIAASIRGASYAVFFIDLDRFNLVNETLGHLAGDELLKTMARRLRDVLPEKAQLSRLGGDEFVVLAEIAPDRLLAFGNQLLESMRKPMLLSGRAIYTTASIGIVAIDSSYTRPVDLLRDADIAMYAAKRRGRQCCAVFDMEMRAKIASESELESALRSGLERHEFVPHYQPVVAIATREIVSFEALVRWNRPGRAIVGAAEFIAYAETHGLVDAIDDQMLDQTCADAHELFQSFPGTTIAVNVSAAHLMAPDLAGTVARALREHGLTTDQIRLELTETAVMANAETGRATLDRLRENGMQIILDDFGSGHSSLAYLHDLPIAGVKIDRSFISPLPNDLAAVAIVRSIVALAGTLGLYTVAEGVETLEQLEMLAKLGVLYAQGFFFSPAVALNALVDLSASSAG